MARTPFELRGKTVFVAGHRGMAGSALLRRLAQEDVELLTVGRSAVDLRDQAKVLGLSRGWRLAFSPEEGAASSALSARHSRLINSDW